MANTTTRTNTLETELNKGDADTVPDVLRKMQAGSMFAIVDTGNVTIGSSATITLPVRPLMIQSLRVVTGTATGMRQIGDASATPSTTLVAWDGNVTITCEAVITVYRLVYIKAPNVAMSTTYVANT